LKEALAMMAKAPIEGQVKTRLIGTLTAEDAKQLYVAFLSDTPRKALQALADWAAAHGLSASVGAYSDREFYLDAPEAFVDFVVEAMRPELADYGVPD